MSVIFRFALVKKIFAIHLRICVVPLRKKALIMWLIHKCQIWLRWEGNEEKASFKQLKQLGSKSPQNMIFVGFKTHMISRIFLLIDFPFFCYSSHGSVHVVFHLFCLIATTIFPDVNVGIFFITKIFSWDVTPIKSDIPIIEIEKMNSMLKIKSDEVILIGELMEYREDKQSFKIFKLLYCIRSQKD